ncbi:MAG: glycosyltransferase family 2 protein, partial [Candidatus Diapherotrites archaeon]|nr:glycosyltransferase family 2 protein [Candidatus Diapherotrites archaeon]
KVSEIFVIDDASPDNSYLTAIGYKEHTKLHNLKIMRNEKNQGYGGNQKIGYKYAMKKDYDIIVMLHGDAQYAPENIPDLIKPLEEGKADFVFGSRFLENPLKGGMPIWRFIGNKILTIIENNILGLTLTEYHSGFRAFTINSLKKINLKKLSNNYYFDQEIIIMFKIHKLKIGEIPIPTHYGKESHSPTLKQTFEYFVNTITALIEYKLSLMKIIKSDKYERI